MILEVRLINKIIALKIYRKVRSCDQINYIKYINIYIDIKQ